MLGAALILGFAVASSPAAEVAVGTAKVDVTPKQPVLLTGYGHRVGPYTAIDTPLWARAIAIGDDDPVVLVAIDNCGASAEVVAEIRRKIEAVGTFDASRFVVAATHTHNAPQLEGYAPVLWEGRDTPEERARVAEYTKRLIDQIVEVAAAAVHDRKPAELSWGQGKVMFGGNRRAMKDGKWVGFGFAETAPVDHSMPALFARRDGKVVAVWANYACHCTSAGSENRVGGDWAGFAAKEIETAFPDANAVITIGCGADVGPQPTGNLDFSKRHGKSIAAEVERLAAGALKPLNEPPKVEHRDIKLPLSKVPDRAHWGTEAKRKDFEGRHAQRMLRQLDRDGALPTSVPFPITVWKFDDDLAIVFLAGEMTVDYAVRLKHELDWERLWINGWSNGVPCYVPSRRVLAEGGYEPDFSMIYYAWPSRFDPAVEDVLVNAVKGVVGDDFKTAKREPDADLFRVPEGALPSMRK
jgi:hypothetical protein